LGYGGARHPRICEAISTGETKNNCPLDPYRVVGEKNTYVD
jgi:hypothetical protein